MISNNQDTQIQTYENYLLAQDKAKYLESLVPNSQVHTFLKITHEFASKGGNISYEMEKKIQTMIKNKVMKDDSQRIAVRYLLNQIEKTDNSDYLKDYFDTFNQLFLKQSFDHTKPNRVALGSNFEGQSNGQDEELDLQKLEVMLSQEEFLRKMKESKTLLEFNKHFDMITQKEVLNKINPKDLLERNNEDILNRYLNKFQNFVGAEHIVDFLVQYYKINSSKNSNFTMQISILRRLTYEQLGQLADQLPILKIQRNFTFSLLLKQFSIKDQREFRNYPAKEKAHLLKVYRFAQEQLCDENLIAQARRCLLVNSIFLNELNFEMIVEYLRHPQSIQDFFIESHKTKLRKRILDLKSWACADVFPDYLTNYDEDKLYEYYTTKSLSFKSGLQKQHFEVLKEFFPEKFLKHIIRVSNLSEGVQQDGSEQTDQEIDDNISETSDISMSNEKNSRSIKILEYNKKKFEHGDATVGEPVEIHISLKNIPQLEVKVYEINTIGYCKQNQSEFDINLNLDGLIAESTTEFIYSQFKDVVVHTEVFKFEKIQAQKRGLFVIEFQGGGLSSRAVVRKGALTLIRQTTSSGLVFMILDESKQICKGESTGIFIDDIWYGVNDKGEINFPFSVDKKKSGKAVVIHEGFGDLAPYEIPKDTYSFFTSLIFNEESLQPGNKTELIIQPKLLLNANVLSLEHLKDINVTVIAQNQEGIASTEKYTFESISYQKDVVLPYLVPQKVKSITVKLTAKLKSMPRSENQHLVVKPKDEKPQSEVEFSTSDTIQIRHYIESGQFFWTFLKYSDSGYEVFVQGQNGENLKGKQLKIEFSRSWLAESNPNKIFIEFQTKERGVKLGHLPGVDSISVYVDGKKFSSWNLSAHKRKFHLQSEYEICEGESLVIPSFGKNPSKNIHSLIRLETASIEYPVEDCFSKIKRVGENFELSSLDEGKYKFVYGSDIDFSLFLTVHPGKRWRYCEAYIDSKDNLSKMLGDLNYMTLENSEFDSQANRLKLKIRGNLMNDTKVHIMGYLHCADNTELIYRTSRKICPVYQKEEFLLAYVENSFLSERKLADEIQYVLDRKNKEIFMGNTLEKPTMLLKRHYNKETIQLEEQLQMGRDFKDKNAGQNDLAGMKNERGQL